MNSHLWMFIILYILFMNLYGILMMRGDKRRAARQSYRIPERRFFLLAWAGGAWGIFAGMYIFRHKTLHRRFVWGIPLIGLLQIGMIGLVWAVDRGWRLPETSNGLIRTFSHYLFSVFSVF